MIRKRMIDFMVTIADASLRAMPSIRFLFFVGWIAVTIGTVAKGSEEETAAKSRRTWSQSGFQGAPDPPPPYRVELAFPELKFSQPVTITNAPGSDRLFVVEVGGKVFSFPDRADITQKDLFADLRSFIPNISQTYGLTFHPEYPEQPYVYVCYILSGNAPDGSIISRFEVDFTDFPRLIPSSERILIRWLAGGHNGCSIKFGHDGFLYISTGDGTGPNPPDRLRAGQDVTNLLSAILRIDVDQMDGERNYSIPDDNPFVDLPSARPEIWSYGFRNPWKMSFDRDTGDLWVGDVGWDTWELIYRVERGANYGWSITEGSQPIHPDEKRGPTPIRPPVTQHDHAEARSITGGFVYRGKLHPKLAGTYIYGDYATGKIWGLRYDGQQLTERRELADSSLQIVAWGENNAGELYLLDYQRTNQIYKLVENDAQDSSDHFPLRLSDTGLFQSVAEHQPAEGVLPYQVNVPTWADGMQATRLLALPGDAQIGGNLGKRWAFPDGTVIARTVSTGSQLHSRRLETQVMHRFDGTWRPYTYVWNEQQNDAFLAPTEGADLNYVGAAGDPKVWHVASRAECKLCHSLNLGAVLGLNWLQANCSTAQSSSQLDDWYRQGILAAKPPADQAHRRLVDPQDTSEDLSRRARSYLHANCVHCHQPGGIGASVIHLDYDLPLEKTFLVDQKPAQGMLGLPDARILVPQNPYRSVMFYRLAKQGPGRMPHVGVTMTDPVGLQVVHDWIAEMQPTNALRQKDEGSNRFQQLLTTKEPETHRLLISDLLSTPEGALATTWKLYAEDFPTDLKDRIVAQSRTMPAAYIRDLLEPFLPADQKKQRLGNRFDAGNVLNLVGDSQRGRHLYWNDNQVQCRSCHQIFGNGGDLGPPLSAIGGKYKPAELLQEVIEPSKKIEPAFVTYAVVTDSGMVYSGRVIQRDADQIVIKLVDQKVVKIPMGEVEEISPAPTSLMPEYLLRDLDAQEAADLLAYLLTLK